MYALDLENSGSSRELNYITEVDGKHASWRCGASAVGLREGEIWLSRDPACKAGVKEA